MRHLPNDIVVNLLNMKFEGEARVEGAKRPKIEGEARTDGEERGWSPSSKAPTAGEGRKARAKPEYWSPNRGRNPSKSATAWVTRPSVTPGQRQVSQLVQLVYYMSYSLWPYSPIGIIIINIINRVICDWLTDWLINTFNLQIVFT